MGNRAVFRMDMPTVAFGAFIVFASVIFTVAVLPWLFTMLVFLVMVTYIPEISLWLPRALGML